MSDGFIKRDFLAQHGFTLIDQGYTVVPIRQGKKAPGYDGWEKAKPSKDQVRSWLDDGFAHAGVGILTKYVVAIDIDTLDEATADKFEAWCHKHIGSAPVRIGKFPKRLLLYRTTSPFRKKRSTVYKDEWGDKQLIEVLADGQQFVAYHIHPETGKPYYWINDKGPLQIRASDLTEVTEAQIEELIASFEIHAKAESWEVHKQKRGSAPAGDLDRDNPWAEDSTAVSISIDELRQRLMLVSGNEDYDTWFQVGMALYHQGDGDIAYFDLWNEWSESADNYDPDALDRKWASFDIEGKKRAPLTARYILRLAKEAVETTALELSQKLRDAFVNAKDLPEWEKARQATREAEIDGLARSALAVVAKDRRDAITGVRTSLIEIKKAISYQPRKVESTPTWCEGWVYDTSDDKFFHTSRKIAATKQGFDAMYDRQSLTKSDILNGKNTASQTASFLALNLFMIPTVDGRRYMPGRDSIFHEPDGRFANTYPEHEIPEVPEKLLPRDTKNIDRVKAHISHLLADPVEQRMLLDWMSWVVQNPGKHVNYAVLLQGVEGDGKTFFAELLRAVMGVTNVKMANANTVIKTDFTGWAYGQCVCAIEEIRLVNGRMMDKWDAINKIKPFITNNVIEVYPKGKAGFNVTNTTSYMLFSNFKDALPLDDNSRRYLVLFSKWQHREEIQGFKLAHPNYYIRLYNTLVESAGALRQWLLDHEQHDNFNPLGDAPETSARKTMIRKSKSEFIQVLDEVITEDEEKNICRAIVDVTELQDVMVGRGIEWPSPKLLSSLLERDGYESLGKVRLSKEAVHTFYTKTPDLFTSHNDKSGTVTDASKVKAYLQARAEALENEL